MKISEADIQSTSAIGLLLQTESVGVFISHKLYSVTFSKA